MAKNILMPYSFLVDVQRLIFYLYDYENDERINNLRKSLESQIEAKLAAQDRHKSFSKYKSAPPSSVERESFRREYLDKAGIHKDWRSDNEITF